MRGNKFVMNKHGQAMAEYILLVMLIAIVALGAFTYFGLQVENKTNEADTELRNAG